MLGLIFQIGKPYLPLVSGMRLSVKLGLFLLIRGEEVGIKHHLVGDNYALRLGPSWSG